MKHYLIWMGGAAAFAAVVALVVGQLWGAQSIIGVLGGMIGGVVGGALVAGSNWARARAAVRE